MSIKEILISWYARLMYYPYKGRYRFPTVVSTSDTLETVISTGKSMARFGDGELHLVSQTENLGFQSMDHRLSERLREVLTHESDACIICLPAALHSVKGFVPSCKRFWKRFIVFHYRRYIPYLNFNRVYFNTNVTRPYMDYKNRAPVADYFERLKDVWKGKHVLIVEGSMTRLGVGNDLLTCAASIKRMLTTPKNAFSLYDRIFGDVSAIAHQFDLVLIALGPTATVLAYDLSKLGVQAIDIGHIDIEYEWFLRGVTEKVAVAGKHVNEVSTEVTEEETADRLYHMQIIKKIIGKHDE